MTDIVQFTTLDVILLFLNLTLILIRLRMVEKRVKVLESDQDES